MKFRFSFAFFFLFHIAYSQRVFLSEKDVFKAKEIIFYGYDYGHFRLIEESREKEAEMTNTIVGWNSFCLKHIDQKRLLNWYSKQRVIFQFDPTDEILTSIDNDSIVSSKSWLLNKDDLQDFVNHYQITEKEGIGHVVIVEYFSKESEISSAYFVFFDIATKKILMSDKYMGKEADGYGLVNFWGTAMVNTFAKYVNNIYKRRAKRYD